MTWGKNGAGGGGWWWWLVVVVVVVGVMAATVAAASAAAVVVLACRPTYYIQFVGSAISCSKKNALKSRLTLSLVISVILPKIVT